jgi:MFS family permease
LEILSVRLLAPYVGLTLETTTSIIGAALGGRLADRLDPHRLVVGLLIGGGLLVLLTVPIVRALGPLASEGGNLAAVGVTFAALVPVAAVLSGVTPTVARLQLRDLRASGTTVGGLSAWATAGALVGTFGTGFVLVPLLPVSTSVLAIGIALVLVGLLLGVRMRVFRSIGTTGATLIAVPLIALSLAQHSPCEAETSYYCVQTEPAPAMGAPRAPLRAVFVGGGAFTWLAGSRRRVQVLAQTCWRWMGALWISTGSIWVCAHRRNCAPPSGTRV